MLCPLQEGPFLRTKNNRPVHELCTFMIPETYVIDVTDDVKDSIPDTLPKSGSTSLVPISLDNNAPSPTVPNDSNEISMSVKTEVSDDGRQVSSDTLTSSDTIHPKVIVMGIESIPKGRWNLVSKSNF